MAYILLFRAWFYGWRIYGRGPNLVIHLGPSSWRGFPRQTGIIYLLYRQTFMLNWLVPAWVGSRNKKQQLSTMLFGGSSLTRSVTNGCSAVLLVINLAFWWVYLNLNWLLTSMYFYKPRFNWINASSRVKSLNVFHTITQALHKRWTLWDDGLWYTVYRSDKTC